MREIQRVSITDTVVNELKEMILSGQFAPGEKLPTENEMCQNMKVSRTCVREAVRVLQALGLVDIFPGKGSFVSQTPIDTRERWYDVQGLTVNDFIEVRMAIETVSTKLAISKAKKHQVDKLESIHKSFLEANEKHNLTELIMYDEMFHSEIVNITGNKLLISLNRQLIVANRKFRCESFMNDKIYRKAVEPHTRILQCFRDKNAEQGRSEMQHHLEITRDDMQYLAGAQETDQKT